MIYPCLKDYFKDDIVKVACLADLFSEIETESTVIFAGWDSELYLDTAYTYYFERCERPLKSLYWKYCEDTVDWEDTDSISGFAKHIAKVAFARYGANWLAIWNAYFLTTYNPLENYDMEQKRSPLLDTTNTQTRKQETKVETNGETSVVPFNDTEATLTGSTKGDATTTEDKTKNEIESKIEERGTDTLTRHGNIGVTTSQQMLQSELDLRKLDFLAIVFRDIDKIVLRNFYPTDSCFPL